MSDNWRIERKTIQKKETESEGVSSVQENTAKEGSSQVSKQKKSKGSALLVFLLLLVLLALGYYTYTLYKDKQYTVEQLSLEKQQMLKELTTLREDYEKATSLSSGGNTKQLEDAKEKIQVYIDSLKLLKSDIAALWKYREQVQILKQERERLLQMNDSLVKTNKAIATERDSIKTERDTIKVALDNKKKQLDSVAKKNTELNEKIKQGSVLSLKKLDIQGVRESSNGKYEKIDKARSTDKLKICYTVAVNRIGKEGERFFYIQVIDPQGVTLGKNETTSKGATTINYSIVSSFYYEKKLVDVCEYISKGKKSFQAGTYRVKVYDEELKEINATEFTLK